MIKTHPLIIASILGILISIPCAAESSVKDNSPQIINLNKCLNEIEKRDGSYLEMGECYSKAFISLESELLKAWKASQASLIEHKNLQNQLLEEQRLWIKWKDKACMLYDDRGAFGRLGGIFLLGDCKLKILVARIAELKIISNPYGGN